MSIIAENVLWYEDTETYREVIAVPLGHRYYMVLFANGASHLEVRRYGSDRLHIKGDGRVALSRLRKILAFAPKPDGISVGAASSHSQVNNTHRPRDTKPKVSAPRYFDTTPHARLEQLLIDETLVDRLRGHEAFTADVESAFRLAIANAHIDAAAYAYAYGMTRAMDEYGYEGVRLNTAYMVNNLKRWAGVPAAEAKKILLKWAR